MSALNLIDNILTYIDECMLCNIHRSAADSHSHLKKHNEWGYGLENGPSCWSHVSAKCASATGQHQSPINITTECKPQITEEFESKEEEQWDLDIKYGDLAAIQTSVVNNGHTIQMNVDHKEKCFIELYDKRYELKQFHFHTPSEHTEDGQHYPMEMHLVHQNKNDQSIAVIGFFFDTNRHLNNFESLKQEMDDSKQELLLENDDTDNNQFLSQFWSYLPQKNETNHDALNAPTVSIKNGISFLPLFRNCIKDQNEKEELDKVHHSSLHLDLFYYEGSLTTPPCSEGVKWMVIKTPQLMSLKQLTTFHKKLNYLHNARTPQKANGRIVHLISRVQFDLHQ